jgi:hypothetical protein
MWSEWKNHTQGPAPVPASTIVIAKMCNGDVLSPLRADEMDWNFPGDAIVQYKVKQSQAMADLKRLASLESVGGYDEHILPRPRHQSAVCLQRR